jgi:hypothetical protein
MRNCDKGKPCLAACIRRSFICWADLADSVSSLTGQTRDYIKKEGGHIADHIGKNVAAWKTGKILGGLISGYLESQYNIPREISIKLAETAVQGLAATGLDIKNMRNNDELLRKLFTETAAAFIGKTSHTGVETIVSAKEMGATLENALPILAGKISGIGTALLSNKLPTPKEALGILSNRSKEDIGKIRTFLENQKVLNFSSHSDKKLEEIMGDLILIIAVSFLGKNNKFNMSGGRS